MMMEEIQTQILNMPTSIKAFVKQAEDGTYTIILNAKLTHEAMQEAFLHELWHITHGDFQSGSCGQIEAIAHGEMELKWAQENYPLAIGMLG